MTVFFGFGIAPSMFKASKSLLLEISDVLPEDLGAIVSVAQLCLNPSHKATIAALSSRYGVGVEIPPTAAKIALEEEGDAIVVMTALGLPRLEGRHEYTQDEIDNCEFKFMRFQLVRVGF